jgi:hypothetical protein
MALSQHEAAEAVIAAITAMAQDGVPLMQRVLPEREAAIWQHYPDNDARDARTRSRWYYHVHPPGERDPGEHGHFHLFLHRTQMDDPAGFLVAPEAGEAAAAHVAHIAGLSISPAGIPVSWFVTNRWVTDEFLYPAPVMRAHLDRYDVDETGEDPLVNRLLTAMVALYRDELAALLDQRDAALAALVMREGPAAYEAGHEVLANLPIDLDEKITALGLFD